MFPPWGAAGWLAIQSGVHCSRQRSRQDCGFKLERSKTLMSVEMKKQLAAGKIQKLYYVMHNRRMAKTRQALREQVCLLEEDVP